MFPDCQVCAQSLRMMMISSSSQRTGQCHCHSLSLLSLHFRWFEIVGLALLPCSTIAQSKNYSLTFCRAQRPKMSVRGRGQNIPKCLVMIGKLRCFQTRKFPYNLARISWIITVWDFRYFLPRHLHCLCVRSESERVFLRLSRRNALPVFETGLLDDIRQRWMILWLLCWRYCDLRSCSRLRLRH